MTAAEAARMLSGYASANVASALRALAAYARAASGSRAKPRCPREIDGVDKRGLFGIVGAERSRGQRLRFGDLTIEVVGAQADELERIEHEALVKAGF